MSSVFNLCLINWKDTRNEKILERIMGNLRNGWFRKYGIGVCWIRQVCTATKIPVMCVPPLGICAASVPISTSDCRKPLMLSKIFPNVTFAKHCNENSIYVFSGKKLHSLSPKFHIHVSASSLYIPTDRSTYFLAAEWAEPSREYSYKSLTDIWMWKLGLRWPNSFSGNICF